MNNVEKFINELVREGKSHNTIVAYRTDIEQFKVWLCDSIGNDTDSITQVDIRQYVQYMNINQKRSVSTINRKVKSIVQYAKYLNNTNISNTTVCTNQVKQKSVDNVEVKVIDKQDLYKLKRTIYASNNKRDITIYELLINTAVRCSELISIDIEDIHLTDRNGKNNYSYIDIRAGKGNKNRRIPLNTDVVIAITEYLKVRPLSKDNRLLQGQRGSLTRIAINKLLEVYSKQCGIEVVTPHMFRHTALNIMVKNGADIKTVAEIAGHSSTDLTYKYYVSSNVEDKMNAIDVLQNSLIGEMKQIGQHR